MTVLTEKSVATIIDVMAVDPLLLVITFSYWAVEITICTTCGPMKPASFFVAATIGIAVAEVLLYDISIDVAIDFTLDPTGLFSEAGITHDVSYVSVPIRTPNPLVVSRQSCFGFGFVITAVIPKTLISPPVATAFFIIIVRSDTHFGSKFFITLFSTLIRLEASFAADVADVSVEVAQITMDPLSFTLKAFCLHLFNPTFSVVRPYSPTSISKAATVIRIRCDYEIVYPDIDTLFLAFKLIEASVTVGPDRASHISPEIFVGVIAIVNVMFSHVSFLKLPEGVLVGTRARVIIHDVHLIHQTFT
mmetsp:Transcript_1079/g.1604  ORF Transcript_1079/g.1604 Transcript_1079/m.1604 type:complete len:305 (-) Transcript_1079:812-1726(-)